MEYKELHSPTFKIHNSNDNTTMSTSEREDSIIEAYYQYLSQKLDFYLSKRVNGRYGVDDIASMKQVLRYYVEMKYSTPNKRTQDISQFLRKNWRQRFKQELIATILQDAITNPNQNVIDYFFEPRESNAKTVNRFTGTHVERPNEVRVVSKDKSICKSYELYDNPLFSENEILEKIVYQNVMNRFGFSKDEKESLFGRYAERINRYGGRKPIRASDSLALCENFELLSEMAQSDDRLVAEDIVKNAREGLQINDKIIAFSNPSKILARRNFLNWVESNSRKRKNI